MSVRVAAVFWFRNALGDYVASYGEKEWTEGRYWSSRWGYWNAEKKKDAQKILDDFEALKWYEDVIRDTRPVIGPGVALLRGTTNFISYPMDPDKLRDILFRTHRLFVPVEAQNPRDRFNDPFVDPDIYFRMGQTFQETNMKVEDYDLKYLIERATAIRRSPYEETYDLLTHFDPRRELKERIPTISKERK